MLYFICILAALGVAGLGWSLRNRSTGISQTLIALGCVGCVAAIGWQVRATMFPADAKPPNRAHSVVGFFLASAVQRDIMGQRGSVVVLLPGDLDDETAEGYVNSFRAPLLRGHPEWEVQTSTIDKTEKGASIPAESFKQVLAKHPNAVAFVSFSGTPSELESTLARKSVPVLVFDPRASTNWVADLVQRRIRSVIVPRPDVDPASAAGVAGLPGEIFGKLYYLATPENAEQIAAKLAR